MSEEIEAKRGRAAPEGKSTETFDQQRISSEKAASGENLDNKYKSFEDLKHSVGRDPLMEGGEGKTTAEKAKDMAGRAVDEAKDLGGKVTEKASELGHKASDLGHKATEKASELGHKIGDTLGSGY